MAQFDQSSELSVISAFNSAVIGSGTTSGVIIDTNGFDALTFEIYCSAFTTGVATAVVFDSNDSGMAGATAVDADFLIGDPTLFAVNVANEVAQLGYVGKKRYVQLRITGTSTPVLTVSGTAILGKPANAPVGQAF